MGLSRPEIQRRYRNRQRGGPPRPLAPHGTLAAYRRHQRHGEDPCAECKAARAARRLALAKPA